MMFEKAYKNWTVDVSSRGNARIVAPRGAVALVRARKRPEGYADRKAFGKQVLAHLLTHGLVRTVKGYKALMGPKLASLLDDAVNDMSGVTRGQPSKGASSDGDDDLAGADRKPYDSSTGAHQDGDADHDRGTPSADGGIHQDSDSDHDRPVPSDVGDAQDDADDDLKDTRSKKSVGGDSVLDDRVTDHKAFKVVAKSWMEKNQDKDASLEAWLAIPTAEGYVLSKEGEAIRHASADQFKAQWLALDKTPIEEAKKLAKHDERIRKLYEARLSKAANLGDDEKSQIATEAVDRFARALRIVARRQTLGMEESVLKGAVASVLANRRVVGQSPDGTDLMWVPLSDDLAIHLTESAWAEGQDPHIDDLLGRAAKLAGRSDEYLRDAQADLENHNHRIASLTNPEQVDAGPDLDALAARQAAQDGNLQLGPTPPDEAPLTRQDKSAALRQALGGTKTGHLTRQIRAP